MRKKIALFAGGWGGEYLQEVLAGVIHQAEQYNTDIFAFISFSIHTSIPEDNIPEINFMKLPDINDFDGVIVLANSFNTQDELDYITEVINSTKIPAISVEYELPGIPTIMTDNYYGMHELSMHLFKEHNVKNVLFIGGPKDHPECIERLNALLDAAKTCNVNIPKDNIIYADWSKARIAEFMNEWKSTHDFFPDAIVCANDIMAMETCTQLELRGLSVPEDIIVTGYDCILPAQRFVPSITSVNHEWNTMGRKAFNSLINMIGGGKIPGKTLLPTRFVSRRSCGCHVSVSSTDSKKDLGRALVNNELDAIQADSHFRHFYVAARRSNNLDDFSNHFSYLFEHLHIIEGDSFALYLDPEFFNIVEDNSNLRQYGHADEYNAIITLKDGKAQPHSIVSRHDAIFGASSESSKPGYYLFFPICSDTYTLGFTMLTGVLNGINDSQYYIWTRHMNQALEQVRSNITIQKLYQKMRELSIRDFLTGTYNRTGCETISYPAMIEDSKNDIPSMIILVDVDNMKRINDKFGHTCGDEALTTTTDVLNEVLPSSYNITRFGGDEFLITGPSKDLTKPIDEFIALIQRTLLNTVANRNITFPLTLSIGYYECSPMNSNDIDKGIVHADINMYTMKKLHHVDKD